MTINEFLFEVGKLFADNFPANDSTGLILLACAGKDSESVKAGRATYGPDHVMRALVSMNIDYEGKDTEKPYEIVRDCFGYELTRRVKAGVETGVKAIATKNIKDGKMLPVNPPKTKS